MKTTYNFFLLSLLMLMACNEEEVLQEPQPTGKLAKEFVYNPGNEIPRGTVTYKYDRDGELIRKDYNGYLEFATVFEQAYEKLSYDGQGRIIERIKFEIGKDGGYEEAQTAEYVYNTNGQLERINEVSNSTVIYFFDDQELNNRIEYYVGNTDLLSRYITLEYNQDDQLIRESSYSSLDDTQFMLMYQYASEYDQQGHLIRKIAVDGASGEPEGFVSGVLEEYSYDSESGVLAEKKSYNPWLKYALTEINAYEYF